MKYIKEIKLEIQQINLILKNNIKIHNIYIEKLFLSILKLENNLYSVKFRNENIIVKKFDFEDIILKFNDPGLYIDYAKHVLKKSWEDCRGIIKDELVDSAIFSIYDDLKNELKIDSNYDIGMSYEIGNSGVYEYVKKLIKGKSLEFEEILLNYSNQNGGLQITGIPYDSQRDKRTDKHYRTILDEAIYNYTITNRGGTWPEIGINNREDLLKLRVQIIDHDTLQFRLRGYGELDY